MSMKIGIVTLGCDKNSVDTEHLAGILAQRGHEIAVEGTQDVLDVLIIYTCGFIEAARAQSIDIIEGYLETKQKIGNPRRLILAGCLTQRYGEEMRPELPAVDAIVGVGRPQELADLIEQLDAGTSAPAPITPPSMRQDRPLPRKRLDTAPSAFLKISDGCNHSCTFCAIPAIKGPYVSVPREQLLAEAHDLLASGVRELNLIGQDLAPYGRDLYTDYGLPELLRDLCRLDGDFWIRLLYLYPAGLTPRFMEVFAAEPKICKYLDIPLQHLDPHILKSMRRPSEEFNAIRHIQDLRRNIPGIVIRTTMIVGFPGETPEAFQNLMDGIQEIAFERLGAFVYSNEEGTDAATMNNAVSEREAERRIDRLMKTQALVSKKIQRTQVGQNLRVLVEFISENGAEARGRSYREAPEVDGEVIIQLAPDGQKKRRGSARVSAKKVNPAPNLKIGDFVDVQIIASDPYDLYAEIQPPDPSRP